MNEGDDGATYYSGDQFGDPYVTCECGTTIEPANVSVTSGDALRSAPTEKDDWQ